MTRISNSEIKTNSEKKDLANESKLISIELTVDIEKYELTKHWILRKSSKLTKLWIGLNGSYAWFRKSGLKDWKSKT